MGNKILTLIQQNEFQELEATLFNRKLADNSEGSFTEVMELEEEFALVDLLKSKNETVAQNAEDILQKYSSCYPLFNDTLNVLIENIAENRMRNILFNQITRYSCNDTSARKICMIANSTPPDEELLHIFCKSARIFFSDIYQMLDNIDERWATLYKTSIVQYNAKKL